MIPFPIFSITTSGGIVPLPPGIVKKMVITYPNAGTAVKGSMALLLNDGRLFTQGGNYSGECVTGDKVELWDYWNLAAIDVADVWGLSRMFVFKFNDGSFRFAGNDGGWTGSVGTDRLDLTVIPAAITNAVDFSKLKNISSGPYSSVTHYLLTDNTLWVSGANSAGQAGNGTSGTSIGVPVRVATGALGSRAMSQASAYFGTNGIAYVSGIHQGLQNTGTANSSTSFVAVQFDSTGETVFVKDWFVSMGTRFTVGSPTQADPNLYLYYQSPYNTDYGRTQKLSFPAFTSYRRVPGKQNSLFEADGTLYILGATNLAYGTGSVGYVDYPVALAPFADEWDNSKLTWACDAGQNGTLDDFGGTSVFLVYDGNIYVCGRSNGFFGQTADLSKFKNVQENSKSGVSATGITSSVLGPQVIGSAQMVSVSTAPAGADIYQRKITSSDTMVALPNYTNIPDRVLFRCAKPYTLTTTAYSWSGAVLTATSTGTPVFLGVSAGVVSPIPMGSTAQVLLTKTPGGLVESDLTYQYTTSDAAVATVSATGLITAVGVGYCRIGCTMKYQGKIISSYTKADIQVTGGSDVVGPVTSLADAALPAGVTGTNPGAYYYLGSTGYLIKSTTADTMPLEYNTSGAAVGRQFPEPTAVNLLPTNTTLANFTKSGVTITAETAVRSPANLQNNFVYSVTPSATVQIHVLSASVTTSLSAGSSMTVSTYIKAGTLTKAILRIRGSTLGQDQRIDLAAGTIEGANGTITPYKDGWYRVTSTLTATEAQTAIQFMLCLADNDWNEYFVGTATDKVYVWLPQMEAQPFATSPIQNASTSIQSRAGNTLTIARNGHLGLYLYYTDGTSKRILFGGSADPYPISSTFRTKDYGTAVLSGFAYFD